MKYLLDSDYFGEDGIPKEISQKLESAGIHKLHKIVCNDTKDIGGLSMIVETPDIIFVKYFDDEIDKLTQSKNGDLIDVRSRITIELKQGESALIPLGIAMKLPDGYMAKLYPRSSTFKNYGILLVNSVGNIDNSYCGDNDEWMMHVYATRDTIINKNDRIGQFEITKAQSKIEFFEVEHLNGKDRGGFGSTGVK